MLGSLSAPSFAALYLGISEGGLGCQLRFSFANLRSLLLALGTCRRGGCSWRIPLIQKRLVLPSLLLNDLLSWSQLGLVCFALSLVLLLLGYLSSGAAFPAGLSPLAVRDHLFLRSSHLRASSIVILRSNLEVLVVT